MLDPGPGTTSEASYSKSRITVTTQDSRPERASVGSRPTTYAIEGTRWMSGGKRSVRQCRSLPYTHTGVFSCPTTGGETRHPDHGLERVGVLPAANPIYPE